ncbi:pilin protein [Stenotrophomonas sp. GD03701]|uniref:Pilin protein n=1 Tax=Stenotrophomonas maltophilia TaxID=40324 RepID=A0A2J0SYA9_STEMA|nr:MULTISPECIES: CfaE/CblD family pilus tip adhesin [Stenotrophomonas]MBA0312979.1 pilin protein [Stenotrophomonas maltophilia]MBH1748376.1 pilin protein [Stenotrophomonas maltophilia]MBH1866231.1 pilin protein [Stenotrophomonas maltophilia]MDH1389721.1 pilin protein [Stenotrophomonas sp. GD03701]MDH1393175.1 pilin protein [Stenotrophomonas sp. GD03702]
MSRWLWWWLMLFSALVLVVPQAMAQRPPETHPTDEHRDIVMSWDRSAMPGDIVLMPPRTLLAYDHVDPGKRYGELHLTCVSDSSAERGRCPVEGFLDILLGTRAIPLEFVEARSNMRVELGLQAGLERALSGRSCLGDFWQEGIRAPWSTFAPECSTDSAVGTGAQIALFATELEKLVAGIWTATLELRANTPDARNLATYTYRFTLTITDYDAVSIYLPEFQEAAPTVGLNLSYDPIARTVGGRAHLDMCLYDGLGSQSEYLGVTVRDSGTRPPGPTGYSVWHTDGAGGDSQRMDYTVTLDHNGARIPLRNGVEEQLRNIDTARLRLVMLPGMSQPVFCVPTPLTLDTPRVPIDEKRSGAYQGDLKVELRLPTSRP